MTQQRKHFLIFMITGLLSAAIAVYYRWDPEKLLFHQLCDGAFVAGVVLVGIGGLKFARNGGTFDIMVWGLDSVVRTTFPWMLKDRQDADFVAYKERKKESRQSAKPELLAGAFYLALSVIFLVIYLAQR